MSRYRRWNELLELLAAAGQLQVEEAAKALGVSAATVRRDFDELAGQQMLTRIRGGAVAQGVTYDLPLRYKSEKHPSEKQRIAAVAAALVRPGQVVGLNGGTTTTEVARALATRADLSSETPAPAVTVVTNALNIATELAVRQHIKIVATGGVARPQSYELTGPLATGVLEQVALDIAFIGVDGIDAAAGATAHHEGEASINQLMPVRRPGSSSWPTAPRRAAARSPGSAPRGRSTPWSPTPASPTTKPPASKTPASTSSWPDRPARSPSARSPSVRTLSPEPFGTSRVLLLIGGDRGQQSQRLLGPAAWLSLIDGEHLPVGAGQVELVVVQFELADLRVLHAMDAGADVRFDVMTRPEPAKVGALEGELADELGELRVVDVGADRGPQRGDHVLQPDLCVAEEVAHRGIEERRPEDIAAGCVHRGQRHH